MTISDRIRSLVEPIGIYASKSFLDAAMDGLGVVFESEEDASLDASKVAENIANIDKSIELTNSSSEALKNAEQHRIEATQNSPQATDEEKNNIETKAAEKTTQIQQSTDAKVAELAEKKRAIEASQAAKQLELTQANT